MQVSEGHSKAQRCWSTATAQRYCAGAHRQAVAHRMDTYLTCARMPAGSAAAEGESEGATTTRQPPDAQCVWCRPGRVVSRRSLFQSQHRPDP